MNAGTADGPEIAPLAERRPEGRYFEGRRRVRLGDVRPDGTLRLDALARYAQDISNDDTTDVGLPDDLAWVVRRTTVDVLVEARFGEELTFGTFCSGIGGRWAERRLTVRGQLGARYEMSTLWIHVDEATGRPRRLSERFLELYGTAADERRVSARLHHPDPSVDCSESPWPVRAVDFDVFDHVNNAVYWALVEERRRAWGLDGTGAPPWRATMEYRQGIGSDEEVSVLETASVREHSAWFTTADGVVASVVVEPVPVGWRQG